MNLEAVSHHYLKTDDVSSALVKIHSLCDASGKELGIKHTRFSVTRTLHNHHAYAPRKYHEDVNACTRLHDNFFFAWGLQVLSCIS